MATQTTSIPSTAQDLIAAIWCLVQDGRGVADDLWDERIAGIEHYADLLDLDAPAPLSAVVPRAVAHAAASAFPTVAELELDTRALVGDEAGDGGDHYGSDGGRAADRGAARTHQRKIKATALIARHVYVNAAAQAAASRGDRPARARRRGPTSRARRSAAPAGSAAAGR
jgi:hypothetical protein